MKKFFRLPKRARSKARSEIGSIEGQTQSEADPATPRPTESTPDLRIGASTLPTLSPLIPYNLESNGMEMILSRTIHLSTPFRVTQTLTPFPAELHPFPEVTKAASQNPQVIPLTQE
jgi:hypothetical protein